MSPCRQVLSHYFTDFRVSHSTSLIDLRVPKGIMACVSNRSIMPVNPHADLPSGRPAVMMRIIGSDSVLYLLAQVRRGTIW